ncbi:MAG: response regulator [Spirochaetales bacterium]|nr:response regulator [Spirochaetales bacterium]
MSAKIMCVDDSPTIRMLVKQNLGPQGFEIVEASNGQEGLDKLSSDISLFLVDVNMPVMNGFDFVKSLKSDSAFSSKPVVFLTTESGVDKKSVGKELGVNGWIVKPFEPESLVKIVTMLTK